MWSWFTNVLHAIFNGSKKVEDVAGKVGADALIVGKTATAIATNPVTVETASSILAASGHPEMADAINAVQAAAIAVNKARATIVAKAAPTTGASAAPMALAPAAAPAQAVAGSSAAPVAVQPAAQPVAAQPSPVVIPAPQTQQ